CNSWMFAATSRGSRAPPSRDAASWTSRNRAVSSCVRGVIHLPALQSFSMADCLFCRIVTREIPASIVYEDDHVLAFNDINPQAPTHVLVVPKRHIASLGELTDNDDEIVGEVVRRAAAIAQERGIASDGYRTVFNTNRDAGQTVFHIHLHLLGGRSMKWPPG